MALTPILNREQIRAYDNKAIEAGVPGLVLMENAGLGATAMIVELLESDAIDDGPVVIVCGSGNNGGDGFVIGRQLMANGHEVACYLASEAGKVTGDARANLEAFRGLGGQLVPLGDELSELRDALAEATVVVDALFGTGLDRPIEGRYAELVEAINEAPGARVALDIPSGIDCDTGAVLGVAVRADVTVTFAHRKIGMLLQDGVEHSGELVVAGLGIFDATVLEAVGRTASIIEPELVRAALGVRRSNSHKYDAGSVLVVAGSVGKLGAALLCGRAALRSGAGICTLASWPDATAALATRVNELMTQPIDPASIDASLQAALDRRKAVAIGPGLGLDAAAGELVERVVLGWKGPVVVDADAISHFASRAGELKKAAGARILTPHSGELARLLGCTTADIEADRLGAARRAASESGTVVVLKGRHSIVAEPDGECFMCLEGNPVLATAGSGDVLSGIIAALLCDASALEAAAAGVYLHAWIGDTWRAAQGSDRGMLAGDIIDGIVGALAAFDEEP